MAGVGCTYGSLGITPFHNGSFTAFSAGEKAGTSMDTWLGRLALLKTGLGVFRLTGRGVAVGNEGLGLRLGGGPAGLGGFRPGFLLPN